MIIIKCHSERSEESDTEKGRSPRGNRPFIVSAFPERKALCNKTYQTNSKVMSRGMPRLLMCAMSAESASDTFA